MFTFSNLELLVRNGIQVGMLPALDEPDCRVLALDVQQKLLQNHRFRFGFEEDTLHRAADHHPKMVSPIAPTARVRLAVVVTAACDGRPYRPVMVSLLAGTLGG
jgi:hypothetical protein